MRNFITDLHSSHYLLDNRGKKYGDLASLGLVTLRCTFFSLSPLWGPPSPGGPETLPPAPVRPCPRVPPAVLCDVTLQAHSTHRSLHTQLSSSALLHSACMAFCHGRSPQLDITKQASAREAHTQASLSLITSPVFGGLLLKYLIATLLNPTC